MLHTVVYYVRCFGRKTGKIPRIKSPSFTFLLGKKPLRKIIVTNNGDTCRPIQPNNDKLQQLLLLLLLLSLLVFSFVNIL